MLVYRRGTTRIMFCYQTDGPIARERGGGGDDGPIAGGTGG